MLNAAGLLVPTGMLIIKLTTCRYKEYLKHAPFEIFSVTPACFLKERHSRAVPSELYAVALTPVRWTGAIMTRPLKRPQLEDERWHCTAGGLHFKVSISYYASVRCADCFIYIKYTHTRSKKSTHPC